MNRKKQDDLWNYADSYAFMDKVINGMPPLIVCLASNGGVQGKEYNENLPETADELADSIYEAYRAGACMVHIHARDPQKKIILRPWNRFTRIVFQGNTAFGGIMSGR